MAFSFQYDEILSILSMMSRTLNEIDESVDELHTATAVFNATIQDGTATEATSMMNSLRDEIENMKEIIEDSRKKVEAGARGLKEIEERAKNGGLRV